MYGCIATAMRLTVLSKSRTTRAGSGLMRLNDPMDVDVKGSPAFRVVLSTSLSCWLLISPSLRRSDAIVVQVVCVAAMNLDRKVTSVTAAAVVLL